MSNTRPAHALKAEIVNEIVDKIQNSQSIVVAEYKTLTVAQMSELRRLALKQNIEVKVYKDSLVRRAVDKTNHVELKDYLTQQNVFIFSYDDAIGAAKLVAEFAKKNEKLKLKAGIYEGKVLDTAAITEISSMPSKPELYSMFASSLLYPIRQVMAAINAIADKQA